MNTALIEFYYNLGKAELFLEKAPPNMKASEGMSVFRKLLSLFSKVKADATKAGVPKETLKRAEDLANKARSKKLLVKEDVEMLNEGILGTVIWEVIKYIVRAILIILAGWAILIFGTALFPPGVILFSIIAYGIWAVGGLASFIYMIYSIMKKISSGSAEGQAKKIDALKKSVEALDKTIKDYKKAISVAQKEGASPKEIAKMQKNLKNLEKKKQELIKKMADK